MNRRVVMEESINLFEAIVTFIAFVVGPVILGFLFPVIFVSDCKMISHLVTDTEGLWNGNSKEDILVQFVIGFFFFIGLLAFRQFYIEVSNKTVFFVIILLTNLWSIVYECKEFMKAKGVQG